MPPIPVLDTPRLRLRGLVQEDLDAYSAMLSDDEVARFITPLGKALSRSEAWRSMALAVGHWTLRGYGSFAVEERDTGCFVGSVGPWEPEGWPSLECGWTIARPYWGRGYASEAAIAAVRWIFDRFPDLSRIISLIDPANVASQGVARNIGERNSGVPFDCMGHRVEIWEAPREAWLAGYGA